MMNLKTYKQLFESVDKYPHVELSKNFEKFLRCNGQSLSMYSLWESLRGAESDMSYIDFGEKNDMISFLPKNKYSSDEDLWSSKNRQEMKIGRFARQIYKDSGKDASKYGKEIDEIVDLYKQYRDSISGKYSNIKIVKGENIRKWYLEDNYVKGEGTLNNSCMRYEDFQSRLDIFVDNPDKISMIILLNIENKLLGRALLWELIDGDKYMDRVYTVFPHDAEFFEKYAEKIGVELTYKNLIRSVKEPNLVVKLDNINYDYQESSYPYMDTFKCCSIDDNILSNNWTIMKNAENTLYLDWN